MPDKCLNFLAELVEYKLLRDRYILRRSAAHHGLYKKMRVAGHTLSRPSRPYTQGHTNIRRAAEEAELINQLIDKLILDDISAQ